MANEMTNSVNDKKINLNITTPRGLKFVEKADMIVMRCIDGDLGVLYGHKPVSTILGDGILRIVNDSIEKKLAVFGGIAEIAGDTVNIFTTIAQHPEEIDHELAERQRQEAESILHEETEEAYIRSAHVLLRRSLVRLEVGLHLRDVEDYKYDDDNNEK